MRYKVLKDFITKNGGLIKAGCQYNVTTPGGFSNALRDNGFIEAIPERPKTVDDLKENDEYYIIDSFFHDYIRVSIWTNSEVDKNAQAIGDAFLTRQEAEKELDRRKAKVILERDTKGFKPKKDSGFFWFVYWDVYDEILKIGHWFSAVSDAQRSSCFNFATQKDAEASLKAHPDEWKAYLGVEE